MSMMKTVWKAIMQLFYGMLHDANGSAKTAPITYTQLAQETKEATKKNKATKLRAQPAKELVSMGVLLERLDETFAALRLPFSKLSWIPRPRIVGLRKLGVHVVHQAYQDTERMSAMSVPPNRILPAMLCVSFGWSRDDNRDYVYPAVLFAVKENKLPAGVSKCAGQHYLFGAGFKLSSASKTDINKELFWLAGYMTVRTDGSLYLHQEIKARQHTIKVTNPATRRTFGKTITYTTKAWGKASLAQLYEENAQAEGTRICVNSFAIAMNWWVAREENWSVAVKKDGERITFAVPKELTARFFKDRIKVTNENGVTKRIIHYVNAHERVTTAVKTTVKAHIRGLAEFNWKGYGCRVTAPKFNGILSTEFTLEGEVFEDGEELPKTGWIDESKVGVMLAALEEGRKAA